MSCQKKYNLFRQTFPEFVFENYRYDVQPDGLHITFRFRLNDSLVFEPASFIPCRPFLNFGLSAEQMNLLVFNIGMAELVSYWKSYCPPVIRVLPHGLDADQIAFWKKLYFNGLGEFFYTNGIRATLDDFVTIKTEGEPLPTKPFIFKDAARVESVSSVSENYIIPVGGGKDSVVTLDLLGQALREHQMERPLPLVMNPRGATVECCRIAGYGREDFIEIRRFIHPLLLELNGKGALNGHTPFSAMLAFYTLLASALSGRRNIALSNENSANEATVLSSHVNHQYSKSLEFENDFRDYVSTHLSSDFNYFSFLRPLSELQIAMLFAQLDNYHDVFRSCNVGSKQDVWCGHCAKCLFAFIILSPFLSPERLSCIFGRNLLDDESMRLYFRQLTGLEQVKPFECVGTVSEVNVALAMALQRWYTSMRPSLLQDFTPSQIQMSLHTISPQHNLNDFELRQILRHVV
ncbi:MAG: hypothetical protein IJ764_01665 [Bacteroidales bacterium]|nr:hypothetical protein [Bacteroidales bacterium]